MTLSRVVMLDNFDSFTFNVFHGLVEAGAQVEVRRAEAIDLPGLIALEPELLVISPGPKRPEDAHLSLEALRHFGGKIPVLGICLGMQCMAVAFGGQVGRAPEPVHGKVPPGSGTTAGGSSRAFPTLSPWGAITPSA